MTLERLQKILRNAGIASRRKAEELILAGRVSVDGRIVSELGARADARRSRVELDGKRLVADPLVYLVLHKPRGVVTTLADPEGRPSVGGLVRDVGIRVVPVGRLDFHTSGALLLTNDGDFASALLHPRHAVPKLYVAKVRGRLGEAELVRWKQSIVIDGRATEPAAVAKIRNEGDKTWLRIELREGRNRQVRRLGEATGFQVMRLVRVSHAGITAEGLLPGQWRHLGVDELTKLKQLYAVPRRIRSPELVPLRGGRVMLASPGGKSPKRPKRGQRSEPDRRGGERARTPKRRGPRASARPR